MLKRREFGKAVATGVIGASLSDAAVEAQAPRTPKKNTVMHVGGDYHSVAGGRGAGMTERANLEYNLRFGVKSLTVQVEHVGENGEWDLDELQKMKDNCDKAGVDLEAIRMDSTYITLRKGVERDRRLAAIVENIRKASKVGVKVITNHWWVIPIRRNGQTPGRGNTTYTVFKLEDDWRSLPIGKSGRVTSDDYWERITTFLQATIPVCKEHNVKIATLRSAGSWVQGGTVGTRCRSSASSATRWSSTAPTTGSSCVWAPAARGSRTQKPKFSRSSST